ncbi:MAG: hypothetical protein JNL32_03785 [Candidatus Kapabacteria bacterium]|nr:hypothetical protein [Candidatus Kapabacteria bacterium]
MKHNIYRSIVAVLVLALFPVFGQAQGIVSHQGIRFKHPSSPANGISLFPPSGITSYSMILPPVQGATNTLLVNDGTGILSWTPLSSLLGTTGWMLTGNATTSSWNGTTGSFLGTTSAQPLSIATTNATAQDILFYTGANGASERMRITGAGNVGIGTSAASNLLTVSAVSDPLRLTGVQNNSAADTALTISSTGVVQKKSIAAIVSSGMIKGIFTPASAGSTFTISASGDIAANAIVNVTLVGSASDGVIPVMVSQVDDTANTITIVVGSSIDNTYRIHYMVINP